MNVRLDVYLMEVLMKLSNSVCICAIVAILFCAAYTKAEIYEYKGKDGVLHFTDSLAEVPEGKDVQVFGKKKQDSSKDEGRLVKQKADRAYFRRNYQEAIKLYNKVLAIEKKQSTLDKKNLRVVVDNLGKSYLALEDNREAKKIFETGLEKDSNNPIFYYDLACVYAQMNDLDQTLYNLKNAFRFKRHMMSGEHLPNPETDAFFARFMRDERFLQTLKEIRRGVFH